MARVFAAGRFALALAASGLIACVPEGREVTQLPVFGAPDAAPDAAVEDAAPADLGVDAGVALDGGVAAMDAGGGDAGSTPDLGVPDAGPADAGPSDAATPDLGFPDSGVHPDATVPDVGFPDVGFPDAGFPDSGVHPDATVPDVGFPDVGFPDSGVHPDATIPDVGFPDSGVHPDATIPDAGFPDSGVRPDAGFPDSGVTPDAGFADAGVVTVPPPVYNGTCPTFTDGTNNYITSNGQSRHLLVRLPPNPQGRPVIFAWHWYTGEPYMAVDWTGLTFLAQSQDVILVSPYTRQNSAPGSQWDTRVPPSTNDDIQLFDDVLACLNTNYGVDLDRVWVTGHSMGGLFLSLLIQHRAQHIAAAVPMSGGANQAWQTPPAPIPTLVVWGGPTDTCCGGFNFHTLNLAMSANLRASGNFVIECPGTFGHALPPFPDTMWPFFWAHPRTITQSPWASGIPPNTLWNYCSIPP